MLLLPVSVLFNEFKQILTCWRNAPVRYIFVNISKAFSRAFIKNLGTEDCFLKFESAHQVNHIKGHEDEQYNTK